MNRISLLLERKEELVFQHNGKQVHKEVLLWRGSHDPAAGKCSGAAGKLRNSPTG